MIQIMDEAENYVSSSSDFHVRLHLKKWLCYSKNNNSGYRMETDEKPLKFTDLID